MNGVKHAARVSASMAKGGAITAMLVAIVVGLSTAAQAQPPADSESMEQPADARATAFRAVEGPQTEDVPGGALLVGGYALVWLFVMLYLARLGKLHARTRQQMERLADQLQSPADPQG